MPKYIDADEFVRLKRKWYCETCEKRKGMKRGRLQFVYEIGGPPCRACDVDDVISDIEDLPAADVEPVRHGRWIINEINDDIRVLMCSCGFHEKRSTDLRIPRYCEQCGAKMDAESPKEE